MTSSGRSDLVEISAEWRRESDNGKGLAIWDGERDPVTGREVWTWLPASLVERNADGSFTLPEWLATEKGLI